MYDNPFWYKSLKKSPYTPPDYVFGVVWTFLYTLMAISLLLILQTTSFFSKPVLLFMTQMLFNIAWSPLFFKYKLIRLALVVLSRSNIDCKLMLHWSCSLDTSSWNNICRFNIH